MYFVSGCNHRLGYLLTNKIVRSHADARNSRFI